MQWNEYPKTKPEKDGEYLISVKVHGEDTVLIDEFDSTGNSGWYDHNDYNVFAWAELPKPYEKPVRLKAYPIVTVPENEYVLLVRNKKIGGLGFPVSKDWTHWIPIPEVEFVGEE